MYWHWLGRPARTAIRFNHCTSQILLVCLSLVRVTLRADGSHASTLAKDDCQTVSRNDHMVTSSCPHKHTNISTKSVSHRSVPQAGMSRHVDVDIIVVPSVSWEISIFSRVLLSDCLVLRCTRWRTWASAPILHHMLDTHSNVSGRRINSRKVAPTAAPPDAPAAVLQKLNTISVLNFSHLCPEPVLANSRFCVLFQSVAKRFRTKRSAAGEPESPISLPNCREFKRHFACIDKMRTRFHRQHHAV